MGWCYAAWIPTSLVVASATPGALRGIEHYTR